MTLKRFDKEFRPLRLPCLVAAGAGCILAVRIVLGEDVMAWFMTQPMPTPTAVFGAAIQLLLNTSVFFFFADLFMLGPLAFGTEFQHRTLPLVLSQPLARRRLWNEKMLALGVGMLAAVVIFALSLIVLHREVMDWFPSTTFPYTAGFTDVPLQSVLLAATFLLTTVCSAGFWTLLARTTIGGIVFTFASQNLVTAAVFLAVDKVRSLNPQLPIDDSIPTTVLVVTGLIYAAFFLWLGRRKFAQLELREPVPGEGALQQLPLPGTARWGQWLRCRPSGHVANLIRKEVRLLKPVFLVAATFAACWLVTFGLIFLAPSRKELFETILSLAPFVYMPACALLSGCISLGEEKALGLHAWRLTLPVTARRQWFAKLGIASVAALLLGGVLPWLLSWITSPKTGFGLVHLAQESNNTIEVLLLSCVALFVFAFWSVTFLGHTIRAAIAAVLGLAVLGAAILCGGWCGQALMGMESVLFVWIIAYFQLPPNFFLPAACTFSWLGLGATVVVLSLALRQSLHQFRCSEVRPRALLRCSIVLLAVTFFLAFWLADFHASVWAQPGGRLTFDVLNAVRALPRSQSAAAGNLRRTVSVAELEATGELAPVTRRWLRNAAITVTTELTLVRRGPKLSSDYEPRVHIRFPNGREFTIPRFTIIEAPPP